MHASDECYSIFLLKRLWDKPVNGTPMINAPAFHLKKAFILAYNCTTVTNTLAYNSKRLIDLSLNAQLRQTL
jgi:hypothetical protein